jgi:Male enhanced antigen 1 (MEA1)
VTIEVDAEEEVELENHGYQPLPTSNNENDEDDERDEIEFGYSTFDGEEFCTTIGSDHRGLAESYQMRMAGPSEPKQPNIPMDEQRVETIKNIMSNISLPPSAIPVWADTVPDDKLKNIVAEKMTEKVEEKWAKFD